MYINYWNYEITGMLFIENINFWTVFLITLATYLFHNGNIESLCSSQIIFNHRPICFYSAELCTIRRIKDFWYSWQWKNNVWSPNLPKILHNICDVEYTAVIFFEDTISYKYAIMPNFWSTFWSYLSIFIYLYFASTFPRLLST